MTRTRNRKLHPIQGRTMSDNKLEPRENQEESLQELADRWRRETGMHSNPSIIKRNDAYLKLVDAGEAALPFIFDQLAQAKRGLWWMPLEAITGIRLTNGVKPVEDAPGWVATNVPTLKGAWLEWGREHGYLQHPPDTGNQITESEGR